MMNLEEHKKRFIDILSLARTNFLKDGHLVPVAFVITFDGKMEIYAISSIKDNQEKDVLSNFFKSKAKSAEAEAIMFIAESWQLPSRYMDTYNLYSCIAENPKREEIITATYSTREKSMVATAKIIRNDDPWNGDFDFKEKPELGEWEIHTDAIASGRFAGFWN